MNDKYNPCPHCKKLNHESKRKCAWCYRGIPTRTERVIQAIVFWSSIAGILACAYIAYRIGGW